MSAQCVHYSHQPIATVCNPGTAKRSTWFLRTGEQNRVVSNRIVRLWPYVLIVISLIGLAYRLWTRPPKRLYRALPMPCIDRGLTVTEKCSSLVWEPMYEMVLL